MRILIVFQSCIKTPPCPGSLTIKSLRLMHYYTTRAIRGSSRNSVQQLMELQTIEMHHDLILSEKQGKTKLDSHMKKRNSWDKGSNRTKRRKPDFVSY